MLSGRYRLAGIVGYGHNMFTEFKQTEETTEVQTVVVKTVIQKGYIEDS